MFFMGGKIVPKNKERRNNSNIVSPIKVSPLIENRIGKTERMLKKILTFICIHFYQGHDYELNGIFVECRRCKKKLILQ